MDRPKAKEKKFTAVILQPSYLPWLGYFEQMYKSDVFVMYDDVQYDKNGWRNRNRIKTASGVVWLTVPVKVHLGAKIKDVEIDNKQNWRKKHIKNIESAYRKSLFFEKYFEIFEKIYKQEWQYLADIDVALIKEINCILGLERKILRSSELDVVDDNNIRRLVKICQKLEADIFYEGQAGRNYIDDKKFNDEGIKIVYQDYHHPFYCQLYGEFIPYLSVLDLIFNEGPNSLKIINSRGNK